MAKSDTINSIDRNADSKNKINTTKPGVHKKQRIKNIIV